MYSKYKQDIGVRTNPIALLLSHFGMPKSS